MGKTWKRKLLAVLSAGIVAAGFGMILASPASAATESVIPASSEPEIEEAETTDALPPGAKAGDIVYVYDVNNPTGPARATLVVKGSRDFGLPFKEAFKGYAAGAVAGWGTAAVDAVRGGENNPGKVLLQIPAALLGGGIGYASGFVTGAGDLIINENLVVVPQSQGTVAPNANSWHIPGVFVGADAVIIDGQDVILLK